MATSLKRTETEHGRPDLLADIVKSLKDQEGALIPILQKAQETFGYLGEDTLRRIAGALEIPYSEVAGVVSFYSYFTTVPRGKYVLRVCLGTACYVRGGKEILAELERLLGIGVGETTEDRRFSLELGRCFGACGLAPVLMVNDEIHQRVKSTELSGILAIYRGKSSEEADHGNREGEDD